MGLIPFLSPIRLSNRMGQSNVDLALFLYFAKVFIVFYTVVEVAILIYKGLNLPFETRSLAVDAVLLVCFFSVDLIRISTAQSGNKTALRGPVGVSIAFTLPTIMLALYFYLWQTYVLSIEQTLIVVYWILLGLQTLLKFVALGTFS